MATHKSQNFSLGSLALQMNPDQNKPHEQRIAYQGVPGAFSEAACLKACPDGEPLPCEQFETAFQVSTPCDQTCAWVGSVCEGPRGRPPLSCKQVETAYQVRRV